MEIEIKEIIMAALYYYHTEYHKDITSMVGINNYIDMLSTKFNMPIKVISNNKYYDDKYSCKVTSTNIVFRNTEIKKEDLDPKLNITNKQLRLIDQLKTNSHYSSIRQANIKKVNVNHLLRLFAIQFNLKYKRNITTDLAFRATCDIKKIVNYQGVKTYIDQDIKPTYEQDNYRSIEELGNIYTKEELDYLESVIISYMYSNHFKNHLKDDYAKIKTTRINSCSFILS